MNSAGIIKFGNIETMSLSDYDETMNANVRSIVQLTGLCVPHLIQTKGTVVNVSSVCGSRSFPNILAYGMSKAAVDQFTRSVALELASKGVRVNSVKYQFFFCFWFCRAFFFWKLKTVKLLSPGVIVTELQKRGGLNDEQYQKVE